MCPDNPVDNHTYGIVPDSWLEQDSFTVSYSFADNPQDEGWVSFHDYTADYAIVLRNQRFLLFFNGQLYEHNIGPKGSYFGIIYPSYITPVFSRITKDGERVLYPFKLKAINWNTDVEDNNKRLLLETWTSISLHNSFQGTRQIPLVLYKDECSLLKQYGLFNTKRVKNRWYFNYAFNEKQTPNQRTFLEDKDKFLTINTEVKDCIFEELYKTSMFDDFIIIKLLFNNEANKKLFQYEINLDILVATQ